ncbi:MAG: hypothetical protein JWQ81_5248 [Amycolatopsis sp.]|nr:hypothetical protein [Amycolatopsis sp.]
MAAEAEAFGMRMVTRAEREAEWQSTDPGSRHLPTPQVNETSVPISRIRIDIVHIRPLLEQSPTFHGAGTCRKYFKPDGFGNFEEKRAILVQLGIKHGEIPRTQFAGEYLRISIIHRGSHVVCHLRIHVAISRVGKVD